jgi:hypothetical protein
MVNRRPDFFRKELVLRTLIYLVVAVPVALIGIIASAGEDVCGWIDRLSDRVIGWLARRLGVDRPNE